MLAVKGLSHNGPELSPLATIELVISLASGVVSSGWIPHAKRSAHPCWITVIGTISELPAAVRFAPHAQRQARPLSLRPDASSISEPAAVSIADHSLRLEGEG
jgi:hypothetical protein